MYKRFEQLFVVTQKQSLGIAAFQETARNQIRAVPFISLFFAVAFGKSFAELPLSD